VLVLLEGWLDAIKTLNTTVSTGTGGVHFGLARISHQNDGPSLVL
jgi:hypothetical protein